MREAIFPDRAITGGKFVECWTLNVEPSARTPQRPTLNVQRSTFNERAEVFQGGNVEPDNDWWWDFPCDSITPTPDPGQSGLVE
jgi:hypothetical protein